MKQWTVADGGDDNYYWTQKIGSSDPETWIEAGGKKIIANAKDAVSVFEKVEYKDPDYIEFTLSGEQPNLKYRWENLLLRCRRDANCSSSVVASPG